MVVERAEQASALEFLQWRDRWVQLVSRSPDAFLEVDSSGVVVEWDPCAAEMFGWGRGRGPRASGDRDPDAIGPRVLALLAEAG